MSNMYEEALAKYDVFQSELPKIVGDIVEAIPSTTIPTRMKQAIAISEIIRFTSQFHIHIKHWNDSLIPINAITFCIAKSGASKDSSMSAAKKCFKDGYEIINTVRAEEAKERAIKQAQDACLDNADEWAVYKDFFVPANPLVIGVSTVEGFLLHLNELASGSLGSGYIYSGEVGAELASNTNLVDNIKALAELYDEGNKELKALKNRANQTEVNNIATSAMFMGSQDNLLYDEAVKRKFKTEFTTKLGRRSFFVFVNEIIHQPIFNSVADAIAEDKRIDELASTSRNKVNSYIKTLTDSLMERRTIPISIDADVVDLFHIYTKYNQDLSNRLDGQYSITKLSRAHMQWKALKLAGAIALIHNSPSINLDSYISAIRFTELISNDISVFERELAKEAYEVFVSYAKAISSDNKSTISLHTLRKLGYIPTSGNPTSRMKELVQLSNSYDKGAVYKLEEDSIHCDILNKTDITKVSYKAVTGSKTDRARNCASGYKTTEIQFGELTELLSGDFAYTPFEFMDGKRSKETLVGGIKWLVFDVDNSDITDTQCHVMLESINHIIVRTSDPTNEFKFRVLVELDSEIDVPDIKWKQFSSMVAHDLGLNIDDLGKAQIFFSYSESADSMLFELEAECLEVKPYLDNLYSEPVKNNIVAMTTAKKKAQLEDKVETFWYAYEASTGRRSINLIKAAKHARDLGASMEEVLELMKNINNNWINPLPEQEFETCILNQISRWSF